ncbi:MBL fold metallo-hydrolase [Allokutzneria albata]|uniref:Glyoxylase, beta-lactamase superfamily II n=1 Tax=Allokutzneria albata TaxID=211114 RepID=A0A1G9RSK0_ALLAB|nr:MBL fold metallo-hydrolase [Allokutzneria albata]SDM26299.1 Glyoxylase, beta-lactamase superfamily II [Allokutzneria albata]
MGQALPGGVHLFEDTCNVYVLVRDGAAVLIDFGSGDVLDHLDRFGAEVVTDVLITHHHRDQCQGLARAVAAGIRIWVPPTERDLFDKVDEHWQARPVFNYYDLRQDRFSLLEPVEVTGVVPEYRTRRFGGFDVLTLPTPGHTLGSVSYLVELGGRRVAFTGDLVYGHGKVWSLAATQRSYSGVEGVQNTVLSLYQLAEHEPDLVLPSHGPAVEDPAAAFELTEQRLLAFSDSRRDKPWDLRDWLDRPYEEITPHLLRNRTSFGTTYVLLSETGNALLIDYGYDMCVGWPVGDDRSSRRPMLSSLPALRKDFGVRRVEVAVATHYHDDHVAGFNLLREVEGTEIWCERSVAEILADPARYDLPCLWYDPIATDRVVEVGVPQRWHEYELTLHPLPGHTLYAVAIAFEVDGERVIATGDQQTTLWEEGERSELLNLQYKNRFRIDDFIASAKLYRELRPDLIISGHWAPRRVDDAYLDMLLVKAEELADLHRDLLPLSDVDFGAEGVGAWIRPYQGRTAPGEPLEVRVEVLNPFHGREDVTVRMVVPQGWTCSPPSCSAKVPGGAGTTFTFTITPTRDGVRRARIAADFTVGTRRFGQQAEALVDVR